MEFTFRPIQFEDVPAINVIYNHATGLGYATAHTEPLPESYHEQWFHSHREDNNPILVVCEGDQLLGWNSLSNYRSGRMGLRSVKETSYYIHKDHWGRGLASQLMERMLILAKDLPIDTLVTFIMDANKTSVYLMEKFGFELWGRLPGVLQMPNGRFDHLIFGKKI